MRTVAVVIAALASACTTHFSGAAKVKNGPAGCKATCDGWNMDLVGMVKMGEYSDGCICQVKPLLAPSHPPAAPAAPAPSSDASAPRRGGLTGLPAVAGVHLQMQAAAAAAQQSAASRREAEERRSRATAGSFGPPGAP